MSDGYRGVDFNKTFNDKLKEVEKKLAVAELHVKLLKEQRQQLVEELYAASTILNSHSKTLEVDTCSACVRYTYLDNGTHCAKCGEFLCVHCMHAETVCVDCFKEGVETA